MRPRDQARPIVRDAGLTTCATTFFSKAVAQYFIEDEADCDALAMFIGISVGSLQGYLQFARQQGLSPFDINVLRNIVETDSGDYIRFGSAKLVSMFTTVAGFGKFSYYNSLLMASGAINLFISIVEISEHYQSSHTRHLRQ